MAYLGDTLESYATLPDLETGRTATVTLFRDPNGDAIDVDRIEQEDLGDGQYVLTFATTANDVAGHYVLEFQFDDAAMSEWVETEWDIDTQRTIYPSIYTGISPLESNLNFAPHLRDEDDTHDSQYWKRSENPTPASHIHSGGDVVSYVDSTSINFTVVEPDVTAAAIFGTTAGTVAEGSALAAKANTADLAPVATSGDYGDLSNVPTTFTPASHNHAGEEITSGTVATARLSTGTGGSNVALGNHTHTTPESFQVVIGGSGSAITVGTKVHFEVPWTGTLVGAGLFADQTGSIVLDPWKVDPGIAYPPNISHSIIGGGGTKPTLASQSNDPDIDITDWETDFVQGEIVRVNVDSASTLTRVLFVLRLNRTA